VIGPQGAPPRPGWEIKAQVALAVLAVPVLVVGLLAVSVPGVDFALSLVWLGLCAFVITPAWALLLLAAALTAHRGWSRAVTARWLAVPFIAVLFVMVAAADLPLRLRFEASRAEFDRAVQGGNAQPGWIEQPGWIGLYHVDSIHIRPDGTTFFYIYGGGFMSLCGFAHSDTTLQLAEKDQALPLGGGWYEVCLYWD
jgi:hypothetical protein